MNKTRRTFVLLIVAAIFAMLIGMAGSVLAQAPQATPVTPAQDLQATIEALQTQLATQEAVEAEEAQPSPTPPADLAMAEQSEVRMLKDGSRPMTDEEIAHDDALWAELEPWFMVMDKEFAMLGCESSRTRDFVAGQLVKGVAVDQAWEAVWAAGYIPDWEDWMSKAGALYLGMIDQAYGPPPSWIPRNLAMGQYAVVRMDPLYPGCSTGSYDPNAS